MLTVIIAIIGLSLLIIAHEAGHFFTAKYFGIKVDEFGIGFPPRIFAWKPFQHLGHVSYSVYLIHMPVLELTIKLPLPGPAKGILVIVFTLIISHFTYKFVERPFIDLGRKLTAREDSLMATARS